MTTWRYYSKASGASWQTQSSSETMPSCNLEKKEENDKYIEAVVAVPNFRSFSLFFGKISRFDLPAFISLFYFFCMCISF